MASNSNTTGFIYDVTFVCRYFVLSRHAIHLAKAIDLDVHRCRKYVNEILGTNFESMEVLVIWITDVRQ